MAKIILKKESILERCNEYLNSGNMTIIEYFQQIGYVSPTSSKSTLKDSINYYIDNNLATAEELNVFKNVLEKDNRESWNKDQLYKEAIYSLSARITMDKEAPEGERLELLDYYLSRFKGVPLVSIVRAAHKTLTGESITDYVNCEIKKILSDFIKPLSGDELSDIALKSLPSMNVNGEMISIPDEIKDEAILFMNTNGIPRKARIYKQVCKRLYMKTLMPPKEYSIGTQE